METHSTGEEEGLQVEEVLYPRPCLYLPYVAAPPVAIHHRAFPSFHEWVNRAGRTLQRCSHPLVPCTQDLLHTAIIKMIFAPKVHFVRKPLEKALPSARPSSDAVRASCGRWDLTLDTC